jgi:hypothetical protein
LRFTVRRPPAGEVSPCGHRPSAGDVACSVVVGVAPSGSAGFALEDRLALVALAPLWHRSRQPESHPPDLRHPDPTEAAVQPLDVMRFHRDLPKPFVHSGFTPRRAKPRVLGAGLRQLRGPLEIAGRRAARLSVLVLLHRQIPHIPRVPAVRQQCLLLLRGRQQSEPRYIRTLTADNDIPGPSTPAPLGIGFLPGLPSRVSNRRRLR